jgi:DNA-binding HxlR family transcriptional regulator
MQQPIKRLPELPIERTFKVIGGRWKAFILIALYRGPQRFADLTRILPNISQKMLAQQLRELEEHGVVQRHVSARPSLRVEYHATDLGLSLAPLIDSLCAWGRRHAREHGARYREDCIRASATAATTEFA